MKISLNTIRFYRDKYDWAGDPAPEGVEKLVEQIGAQLGAVEEVIDFGAKYAGVVIVKVVSVENHPNADRLHVCKVDDGGKTQDVARDENGLVQVVCGAPNVREDMLVAWLPPGATVPETADSDEPFVLGAREMRGVISNGMLASAKELALGTDHSGILEITLDGDEHIEPGTLLADAYHLRDDMVIDIENKMFTHRPDCFGLMGVAREIAGIQGQAFKSPEWYRSDAPLPEPEADELKLEIRNELPTLVPRFTAVTMRDVQVRPSPLWLQIDLARAGLRPINNIVDYTNYFMLLTGQPLHAYDYDKVMAQDQGADHATIVVRKPQQSEKILLLNGKEIEPRSEAIMIATRDKLIGIGGVMGGGDTEVDETTKNVIIECATFDMYSVRRTSMAHGLFTDAVTRFNKGQSPLQNRAVLAKIVDEIQKFAAGKVASQLIDDNHLPEEVRSRNALHEPVVTTSDFINARLGLKLSAHDIKALLENVECQVEVQGEQFTVTAPFWRTDIEIPEDVVEEVGRLYGYDHLPLELPRRDLTPAVKDPLLEFKNVVRTTLAKAGATEVLTYSFVHGDLLDKASQNRAQAFQLSNALSPDLQYFRLSLTPSLLEKVHANIKAGYDEFALFELGKAHANDMLDKEGLPAEFNRIAFVVAAEPKTATQKYGGAPFYLARKYLMTLLARFGLADSKLTPLSQAALGGHKLIEQMTAPFDPNRAAVLSKDDLVVGVVGEYKASVRKALKLPAFCAGFETFHSFLQKSSNSTTYIPLPRFPKVEQDICLKVPADVTYQQVLDLAWESLQGQEPDITRCTLSPVDIYQRDDDPEHKQITLRLSIASYQRTLTDTEVAKLLDHVAQTAQQRLHAERV